MTKRKLHSRFKHPRMIIAIVVVISLISTALFLYMSRPTDIDRLQMTVLEKMDSDVIEDNVKKGFTETFEIQDYGIYGQTLSFYRGKYGQKKTDSLIGTMVVLRNVETKKELSFAIGESIDSGIQLGTLDPGLYEIYIYENYEKKRVYFEDAFDSETFSTMRNDKHVKDITLHASKEYLSDFGISYKLNYAFLEVNENIPQVKVADVVLDPGGNIYNEFSMQNEPGIITDWINEPQETSSFAVLVQKELESRGLKVLLTREADDFDSYYGSSSRVGVGYKAKAKAFISFEVYEDDELQYPYILTSNYTKGLLANEVAYAFRSQDLKMASITNNNVQNSAVVIDPGQSEEGQDRVYDVYPQLRETGGKQTFTGVLENSSANQGYKDVFGMESIVFMLANGSNEESVQYYQENKEQMAKTIADAICDYYGIGENSETASQ